MSLDLSKGKRLKNVHFEQRHVAPVTEQGKLIDLNLLCKSDMKCLKQLTYLIYLVFIILAV